MDETFSRVIMRCTRPPAPGDSADHRAHALIAMARCLALAPDDRERARIRADMAAVVAACGADWADVHLTGEQHAAAPCVHVTPG